MANRPRIYLDNAATSWPKPEAVYRAVNDTMRRLGAPAGRSAYREAAEVERCVAKTRRSIADLLGADDPNRVIFTANGTDSLNLALHGLIRPGDHVITSVAEHNSVLRPLRTLADRQQVDVTKVPCDSRGVVDPELIRKAIRTSTKLIVLIHASNVTGALQPVDQVGALASEHGILFLVDAAQTLGHVPVDVGRMPVDLVAAPGHKGLLGPLGTGVLYIGPGVEERLDDIRQGGTGTQSELDRHPTILPDKYESGNHNVPGIAGLGAGTGFLAQRVLSASSSPQSGLTGQLLRGLSDISGVCVYGPDRAEDRVGVVSLNITGYDPQEVAGLLDATYGIQVRAGLHCAPRMHESLGTIESGGTVRISPGPFTTVEEIDETVRAMAEISASAPHG